MDLSTPTLAPTLGQLMATGEIPKHRHEVETVVPTRRVTSLSVVMPAKNESASIGTLISQVQTVLSERGGLQYEIVVIDDGSTDGTGDVARAAGARVIRHPQSLGNGAAVKRGFREARGKWITMMDGDGQHPADVIPRLLDGAEEHDMVVASRGGGGGDWHRNIANKIYNGLASYVSCRKIPDLTSGFRTVRADVAKSLVYLLPNTFSYPTTITMSMMRCGYSVGFEPFTVRKREGKSHVRILRDGSRFFLIIMRIATFFAPLRVFMPLSLAMAALGLGWYAVTWLLTGRFTNMAALLLTQATVIFVLGLISEQVAALRFARVDEGVNK